MKKLLVIIFTLSLLITPTTKVDASFKDVSTAHSNFDAINYVQTEGIVSGYNDGTFKPDQTINRAEFTKIIIGSKYSTDEIYACTPNETFSDIAPFEVPWIYQYSCMARNEGIINGYEDGTFKPFQEISFIEAAKIIANTFGYEIPEEDVWYKPFVEKLATEKAIPTSVDSFQKNITRGEMAEMVYRLMAGINDKKNRSWEDLNKTDLFTNTIYNLQFKIPTTYLTGSNSYGIPDTTQADNFFFRKISQSYNGIPVLKIDTLDQPEHGQTFEDFVKRMYDINKMLNHVIGNITEININGINFSGFNLQNGYSTKTGREVLDSPGGRVMFTYQNEKVFTFLQTGADSGLDQIFESVQFLDAQQSWQIYTDENYDFTLKFPPDWRQAISMTGASFGPKDIGEDTLFSVSDAFEGIPQVGDSGPNHEITRSESTTFKGYPAEIVYRKNLYVGLESSRIYVKKDTRIIEMGQPTLNNSDFPFPSEYNPIVSQILDSVVFIEKDPISLLDYEEDDIVDGMKIVSIQPANESLPIGEYNIKFLLEGLKTVSGFVEKSEIFGVIFSGHTSLFPSLREGGIYVFNGRKDSSPFENKCIEMDIHSATINILEAGITNAVYSDNIKEVQCPSINY